MLLKEIKHLPYKIYLSSQEGRPTYTTADFDRTKYDNCECEIEEWEDDDGADENGRTIIRQCFALQVYDN